MSYFSVPWYNKNEWFEVYNGIFSTSDVSQKRNALNIMNIWKARSPSLPSGIESTLCLLGVETQEGDEYLVRLAYSTAIMRFINHALDGEQAKGLSILKAASKMGIPKWVVNLRHETAHSGTVPAMNTLQNAASVALDWLFNNYWAPQYQMMSKVNTDSNAKICKQNLTDNGMEALISFYTTCGAFLYIFKKRTLNDIAEESIKIELINDIYSLELPSSNEFKVLVRECLVKIVQIFKTRGLSKTRTVETLLFHDNALMLSIDAFSVEYDVYSLQRLPWSFVILWEPLLSMFYSWNIMKVFLERLLGIVLDENASIKYRRVAALWLKECFNALLKCQCCESIMQRFRNNPASNLSAIKSKELKLLLVRQYPHFKNDGLTLTLHKSVPEPMTNIHYLNQYFEKLNPFTKIYLDNVLALAKPDLPNECKKKLRNLANIASSTKSTEESTVFEKIYTVNDVNDSADHDESCIILNDSTEVLSQSIADETNEETDLGIWRLATDNVDWSKCPIGVLPWQMDLQRNPHLPICEELIVL